MLSCSGEKTNAVSKNEIIRRGKLVSSSGDIVQNGLANWIGEYVFYDSPLYSKLEERAGPNKSILKDTIIGNSVASVANTMYLTVFGSENPYRGQLTLNANGMFRRVDIKIRGTSKKVDIIYDSEDTFDIHFEKEGDVLFQLEWEKNNLVTFWKEWYPRYTDPKDKFCFEKEKESKVT